VPGDLIEKALANLSVRPEPANSNTNAQASAMPFQWHKDNARFQLLRRLNVEKDAVGKLTFLQHGHV
jgi:hypothetical protein